jgi:hypothetical protein
VAGVEKDHGANEMTPFYTLWLCSGLVYLFAISDRSWMRRTPLRDWAANVVELFWAFILVALPFTFAVRAVVAMLKGSCG